MRKTTTSVSITGVTDVFLLKQRHVSIMFKVRTQFFEQTPDERIFVYFSNLMKRTWNEYIFRYTLKRYV